MIDAQSRGMARSRSACAVVAIPLAGVLLAGCEAMRSTNGPTTPTSTPTVAPSPAPTIGLTVRVLVRSSEEPVAAATVFRNNAAVGQTGSDGVLYADVPLGVEFSIDVTAPGFLGSGASATVTSHERWTFYLEREPLG
jgi:hypothetical protein